MDWFLDIIWTPTVALYAGLGFFIGFGLNFLLQNLALRSERIEAQKNADEILENAKENAEDLAKEVQSQAEEYKALLIEKNEDEINQVTEAIERLNETVSARKQRLQNNIAVQQALVEKKVELVEKNRNRIQEQESEYKQLKAQKKNLIQKFSTQLAPIAETSLEDIKKQWIDQFEKQAIEKSQALAADIENEAQLNLEREAKRTLNLALNRFKRPFCPERGIGNVSFPNPEIFNRTIGKEKQNIQFLEKAAGVDITINEENHYASVLGFDPVRRELGRASLEKLIHEKNLNENRIQEIVRKTKKILFKKIRKDGLGIIRELGLRNVDPEVQNMMGALRYRYSFAQNQYFHCSEVGWLCGLLSAEFGLDIYKGRRTGMLHDIGKAMDHSKDGGHAVIGADFIEKNKEASDVVHAVRAHHFDEQPSTELAYLTIAADAISGARPGARRSTMDSYHQKMQNLEKIGRSFKGVTDTFILNAGREVRVSVNSHQVNDSQALELSKSIAQKIEEEMSYPGLIKVIVVRETHSLEVAK